MFETAEIGRQIDKAAYTAEARELRSALLQVQKELAAANFSVVVVVSGMEGVGKPELVRLLLEWMDPRGIRTFALEEPTPEERERPPMWRYWMALPPKGRQAIFLGSWYRPLFEAWRDGGDRDGELPRLLDRVIEFERMLAYEDVLLLKFWLHLSHDGVKTRFKELSEDRRTRWRVRKDDWKFLDHYDEFRTAAEHILSKTSTGEAPWTIVEATDWRYRDLTVVRSLLDALRQRLDSPKPEPLALAPVTTAGTGPTILDHLDMSKAIPKEEYEAKLPVSQRKVNRGVERLRRKGRSLILVFEGPDAAGKGGAIRRLTEAMDPRDYQVTAVAAPTEEEKARPYLWRFWRNLPRKGKVGIYDRSWYGRVLVERVEGFCAPADWQRAYREINDFEEQLTSAGFLVVKFWLAITPEEQYRRFKEREETPYKQYKLTEEDWRNRAKWDAYQAAAVEMIEKTSTTPAPWVLVEADNKEWARIKVLKTVAKRLKEALK